MGSSPSPETYLAATYFNYYAEILQVSRKSVVGTAETWYSQSRRPTWNPFPQKTVAGIISEYLLHVHRGETAVAPSAAAASIQFVSSSRKHSRTPWLVRCRYLRKPCCDPLRKLVASTIWGPAAGTPGSHLGHSDKRCKYPSECQWKDVASTSLPSPYRICCERPKWFCSWIKGFVGFENDLLIK